MKQAVVFFCTVICIHCTFSQDLKTYKGDYSTPHGINGEISYQYYENADYERIYQGRVNYINKRRQVQSRGICTLKADGYFDKNLKNRKWVYQISDNKGRTTIVKPLKLKMMNVLSSNTIA